MTDEERLMMTTLIGIQEAQLLLLERIEFNTRVGGLGGKGARRRKAKNGLEAQAAMMPHV
jgi:hypothetical protein